MQHCSDIDRSDMRAIVGYIVLVWLIYHVVTLIGLTALFVYFLNQ